MKSSTFWDITPCVQLKVNLGFGVRYNLHPQHRLTFNWLHCVISHKIELRYFFDAVTDPVTRLPVRVCPSMSEAYMSTRKPRCVGYMYSWFSPGACHLFCQRKTTFAYMELCGRKSNGPVETKVYQTLNSDSVQEIFHHAFAKMYSNTVNFSWEILSNYRTKLIKPTREITWPCFHLHIYRTARNN
jgi:hypothetical protein